MKTLFLFHLLVSMAFCISVVHGIDSSSNDPPSTPETPETDNYDSFKSKSVKHLKEFLKLRGLECKGCSEKDEFVSLAFQNKDKPLLASDSTSTPISDYKDGEKIDKEKLDELLAKLKMNGFGGNVFSADDLKNMSPEEMSQKFDPNSKKGSKSKSDKKSQSKSDKKSESKSSKSKSNDKQKASSNKKKDKEPKSNPSKPKAQQRPLVEEETIEL